MRKITAVTKLCPKLESKRHELCQKRDKLNKSGNLHGRVQKQDYFWDKKKICSKCKKAKLRSSFPSNKRRSDGLAYWCKECVNAAHEQRRKNDPEKARRFRRANYAKYIEKHREYRREYLKKNKPQAAFDASQRHKRLKRATPKWLTKEQRLEIKEFYKIRKEIQWLSESPLSVDHIIPIVGKNVCGLHVPWNLQIITKEQNCKKYISY